MDEQRKYAVLFAATILAARKLNDIGGTPWAKELPSLTQSRSAYHILEKIDECWPLRESLNGAAHRTKGP